MSPTLTIGGVAKAADVNVETIRYYQRLKLLDEPGKPPGGVRRYTEAVVERVRFIKRAQELGFSLAEIRRLTDGRGVDAALELLRAAIDEAGVADPGAESEAIASTSARPMKTAAASDAVVTAHVEIHGASRAVGREDRRSFAYPGPHPTPGNGPAAASITAPSGG